MTDIIKEHMLTILKQNLRADGRSFDEFRKVTVEYGISDSAEGSARVKIGDTEVVVGVKMEVGTPFSDKPNEGSIMVNVELRPFSSPDFVSGPPGVDAIELARVVDRVLRESHLVDFKKLCIKEGEQIWMAVIDIYPINNCGNLFDAASLCALAALQDARFPKIGENNKVNYDEKTDKKLPLKNLALSCTVSKIGDNLLVDLDEVEEKLVDARLTIGVLEDGTLCALQKGGDIAIDFKDIDKMIDIAVKKTKELRKALK